MGIERLLTADILDKLVLVVLFLLIVFIETKLTFLGSCCNNLAEEAATKNGETSDQADRPRLVIVPG
jgi:hypothetical protein